MWVVIPYIEKMNNVSEPDLAILTTGSSTTSSPVTAGWSSPFDIQSVDKYAGYFRMGS
jgi:hypothetical protein